VRILRQSWRNLWRNWRRTVITLSAVAASTAVLIIAYSLTWGMMVQMVKLVTQVSVGEVQIHAPGYLADRSIYKTVRRPASILEAAKRAGVAAAPRSYGFGLVSCRMKSAGAVFWGVDPAAEAASFDLAKQVKEGSFLSASPRRGIVLGSRLAKSLDAKVGSEIVALVQAADGSLGNELFTVTGILSQVGDTVDRNAAIIHRKDWGELFSAGAMIHEVAVTSRGRTELSALTESLAKPSKGEDVRTWRQLVPLASDMLNMIDVMLLIFGIVFGGAAGLGVMNTMLMATHERTREFGVLKALGATPFRIVRDVSVEALVLGAAGAVAGTVVGVAASWYFQVYGIDTSMIAGGGLNISGMMFDPIWRSALTLKMALLPALLMLAMCVLSAIYPAVRASRLDPVKAMSHV